MPPIVYHVISTRSSICQSIISSFFLIMTNCLLFWPTKQWFDFHMCSLISCFRATLCRMKSGSVLTGKGDKVSVTSCTGVLSIFFNVKHLSWLQWFLVFDLTWISYKMYFMRCVSGLVVEKWHNDADYHTVWLWKSWLPKSEAVDNWERELIIAL
jgi:hypothetical protein